MGPTWDRQDPGGPHVGPMILAIWVLFTMCFMSFVVWRCVHNIFGLIFSKVNLSVNGNVISFGSQFHSLLFQLTQCHTGNDSLPESLMTNINALQGYTEVMAILHSETPLIARFMGPTWGPSGADRTQMGPMLAPWTLLSGSTSVSSVWPL